MPSSQKQLRDVQFEREECYSLPSGFWPLRDGTLIEAGFQYVGMELLVQPCRPIETWSFRAQTGLG